MSLALGIGANAAMFTLADAVLLRPIPVQEPTGLIRIASDTGPNGLPGPVPRPIADRVSGADLFDGVCGFQSPLATVRVDGRIAQMAAHALTGPCFRTLGIRAALGRLLTEEDDRPGVPKVAVLAYDSWLRDFGGHPTVLGRTMQIESGAFTIVGVAEQGFPGLMVGYPEKLFLPISQFQPSVEAPSGSTVPVEIFARLRRGMTLEQARTRLAALWPRLLEESVPPSYRGVQHDRYVTRRLIVTNASTGIDYSLRPKFRTPLLALLAIAAVVLLATCLNVANLLLARMTQRRGELAVRAALGASRMSLVYDVGSEGLLLLVVGVGGGLLLAFWIDRLLVAIFGASVSTFALDVSPNARILAFVTALSAIAFAVFAIIPAIIVSRTDPSTLHAGSPRVFGSRDRMRQTTVAVQVALTIVLVVIGAGFVSQLRALRSQQLGFALDDALSAQLMPLPGGYDPPFAGSAYFRALVESVAAIPGVTGTALAQPSVLGGTPIFVRAADIDTPGRETQVEQWTISDEFFSALGIPLVAGSLFDRNSAPTDARRVAIFSESAARALFGTTAVVGRRVRVDGARQNQLLEVIGVAADAALSSPRQPNTRVVYVNYWQQSIIFQGWADLIVRRSISSAATTDAIRRSVASAGHEYVSRMWTLPARREQTLVQERLLAAMATAFGALSVALAAIGLYGLLTFSVTQRQQEIAVRMALGANVANVRWLVLRDAVALLGVGIAVGLPLALASNYAVMKVLYGHPSSQTAPAVFAAALMILLGLVSVWRPVKRAAAVDPIVALRSE